MFDSQSKMGSDSDIPKMEKRMGLVLVYESPLHPSSPFHHQSLAKLIVFLTTMPLESLKWIALGKLSIDYYYLGSAQNFMATLTALRLSLMVIAFI